MSFLESEPFRPQRNLDFAGLLDRLAELEERVALLEKEVILLKSP